MLARSETGSASALAWLGLVVAVVTASTFAILQVVHGIALQSILSMMLLLLIMVEKKKKPSPFELQKGLDGLRLASIVLIPFCKGPLL